MKPVKLRHCNFDPQLQFVTVCNATHHHNHFTAPFPGPPGWAGARRELLDFMVQGEINRGRHTDHPDGRHSIRTNQCPPPPSPIFLTGRMLFLLPNQQRQSTEGNHQSTQVICCISRRVLYKYQWY